MEGETGRAYLLIKGLFLCNPLTKSLKEVDSVDGKGIPAAK